MSSTYPEPEVSYWWLGVGYPQEGGVGSPADGSGPEALDRTLLEDHFRLIGQDTGAAQEQGAEDSAGHLAAPCSGGRVAEEWSAGLLSLLGLGTCRLNTSASFPRLEAKNKNKIFFIRSDLTSTNQSIL